MKLPKGMSESDVLKVFDEVIEKLAYKYRFGPYEIDDIKQEALLAAIKGLESYDESRPLANFIYIHVKNRLYNFKRDHYVRLEKPCVRCPLKAYLPPEGCSAYKDRLECNLYANWMSRNNIKRNLTHTLEYEQVNAISERNMGYGDSLLDEINIKEVLELIDEQLPIQFRKTYLMLLTGSKVNKKDRLALEEEVLRIIKENNYEL